MNTSIESYPSISETDEGILSIDLAKDMLEDTYMETQGTSFPYPDLIASVEDQPTAEADETRLTLAYERLYMIPQTIVKRFSDHIIYLDISHNKIKSLEELVHFKHLTSLIADHNPITENCILPPLPKLELLWLNHCTIGSLYPWVGKLKESCPNIQHICLMGNPAAPSYFNGGTFYEYLQYRLFVISKFPSLRHLDDRRVTEDQRIEAQRLYKRPLSERLGRMPQVLQGSVTWSALQNKITNLWTKENREGRNLVI